LTIPTKRWPTPSVADMCKWRLGTQSRYDEACCTIGADKQTPGNPLMVTRRSAAVKNGAHHSSGIPALCRPADTSPSAQIGRVKAFDEPAVDRIDEGAGFASLSRSSATARTIRAVASSLSRLQLSVTDLMKAGGQQGRHYQDGPRGSRRHRSAPPSEC